MRQPNNWRDKIVLEEGDGNTDVMVTMNNSKFKIDITNDRDIDVVIQLCDMLID